MNWFVSLQFLYRHFPRRDEPLSHFSRAGEGLQKCLGLKKADLLIRQEGVFQSLDSENPRSVSLPRPVFLRLTRPPHPKPVSFKNRELPWTVFWPVVVEGECVACWALSPKAPGSALSPGEKKLMEMAADRTAVGLGERALWNGLENANRQNTLGWMSAAVLHEVRNPLTALGAAIQLFPQKRKDDAFLDSFEKLAKKEIGRLIGMTGDLLHFLKADPDHWEKVDLRQATAHVGELVKPLFHSRGVKLKVNALKTPPFRGSPPQIESLLMNLLQNALEAVKTKGEVVVTSKVLTRPVDRAGWVLLEVKDNGAGIPSRDFHRIFRPFFTSKNDGSGLGLAICQKVVENHGGKMEVKSLPGKGTVFSVFFPVSNCY